MGDPQPNSCNSCQRHPQHNHGDNGQVCERCFPSQDTIKLRICAACSTVKYCSTECQKKHWPAHKEACRTVQQSKKIRELLGSGYAEVRHEHLIQWTQAPQFYKAVSFPFSWALGVGTDTDLTETHVILVHVEVQERLTSDGKPNFIFTLKSATCISEEELRSSFEPRVVEMEPRAGNSIRVWIEDESIARGIPWKVGTYTNMSNLRTKIWPAPTQFKWFEHAQRVLAGIQTDFVEGMYISENDETRAQDNIRWYNDNGEHIGRAGLLALEVKSKPSRASKSVAYFGWSIMLTFWGETHCLAVYVRVDQQKTPEGESVFRHTIERAEPMKMQEIEELFHCDVPETEGHRLLRNAFKQPRADLYASS
ncbi:hypothetical protein VNI00_012727 [Paramarasmius palmivorus]|uniref:MYND-type domain-containing protein n=1 Tax=Paramarasmius palmivorus TaxID=297713 RepID=A0AAW0C4W8_9AGAR